MYQGLRSNIRDAVLMKELQMKNSQRQLGIFETPFLLVVLSMLPCLASVAGLEAQDDVEENLIERLEGTIPYDEIRLKPMMIPPRLFSWNCWTYRGGVHRN